MQIFIALFKKSFPTSLLFQNFYREDEPYAEYKVKEGVELAAYVNPDLKSDADSIYENEAYEEMDKKVEDNSDDDGCLPSKSNEYLEPEIKGQKNEPASQPNEYLIPIAQEDSLLC